MSTFVITENAGTAAPSRYFTVRFVRFLGRQAMGVGRFVRSRKMVYTLAAAAVAGGAFYQYENWNGARELAAAREKMLARIGTLDPMAMLPAEVPEADNFFAIPVIKSWRVPDKYGAGGFATRVPGNLEVTPALIDELAVGLPRPASQLIPCSQQCVKESFAQNRLPLLARPVGFWELQEKLSRKMDEAVQTRDPATVLKLGGIMLRMGEAFSAEPELGHFVLGKAMNESTLLALNSALGIPSLTDADFSSLQESLSVANDLKQLDQVFMNATLQIHQAACDWKRAAEGGYLDKHFTGAYKSDMNWWWRAFTAGPLGWWDTNGAFASEQILLLAGDGSPEFWRSGAAALEAAQHKTQQAVGIHLFENFSLLNPRRFFGPAAIPNLINLWTGTAENLFRRRCAILTCALHRHRLKHGVFPDTLAKLDAGLLSDPLVDPARAEAPLNYRLTEKGFLLWSVGLDRVDDQGTAEKDWIWRHEAESAVL